MFNEVIDYIRSLYGREGFIPLHAPRFNGNEKKYVTDCIDSTFVSSIGKYVDQFEQMIAKYTGSPYAIATTSGTSALHLALVLAGVQRGDEVLTQALSFVATANAIKYTGADPILVDSALDNLGMCPESLLNFLSESAEVRDDGYCYSKKTNKRIKACVPMHTFGHPVKLDELLSICKRFNIFLVEDSAESIGSYYKGKHTGTIAPIGILSFNGNKTITCGGGGMILLQDQELAKRAKHLSTTAKIPHKWEFNHSEVAYNYRLPNLNAALACAQMEELDGFLKNKRETALLYKNFFKNTDIEFVDEPELCQSSFWLNAIKFKDKISRDDFLNFSNSNDIMTRPLWTPMNMLDSFKNCQSTELINTKYYYERIVNIPSSVRLML